MLAREENRPAIKKMKISVATIIAASEAKKAFQKNFIAINLLMWSYKFWGKVQFIRPGKIYKDLFRNRIK